MPFADLTIDGSASVAGSIGQVDCLPPGATAATTLAGPNAKVIDRVAGSTSRSREADLDLGGGARIDCDVPTGVASDPSNQSTSSCPPISAPSLSAEGGSASAMLTWTQVANATSYKVLRDDEGCAAAFTIAANVTGTSYTDMGLADGFPEHYTV